MAKKKVIQQDFRLPLNTIIEVVAIKDSLVQKKEMTYQQALEFKKTKGWRYYFYQLGFSSFTF